jgi:RND family efflux transporter MFP subunit
MSRPLGQNVWMRWRHIVALPLVILAGCTETTEDGPPESVAVVAERVQMLDERLQIEAVGSARAQTSAELFPESAGQVREIRFAPGDYVQQGKVLLVLDSRREQLAVNLAQVQVQEAAQLLARYRRIEDTGAISDSQIEAGETALASARVELEQAQAILADRTVRAPFSGHIGLTEIDIGDRIGPETPIAQLDRRATLIVEFPAPEAAFSRLSPGSVVSVSPFSDPGRTIESRVTAVGSSIASDQRNYTVRTRVDNSDDRLRPGMSFRVQFQSAGETRPAVPEQAIVWGGDGSYMWVVRGGTARRVPLTIASRRDGLALIDTALRPGDLVITEGVQKVREGQPVELVRPTRQAPREVQVQPAAGGAPAT